MCALRLTTAAAAAAAAGVRVDHDGNVERVVSFQHLLSDAVIPSS